MAVTGTPITSSTTRWTVNTLAAHLVGALNVDRNAAGGSIPDRVNSIVRMCAARLWAAKDWRFRARRLSLDIWQTQTGTCTGGAYDGTSTVLTANTGTFYESMVNRSVVITGVGTFTITAYTSSTSVTVSGDASAASASAWTVTSTAIYTLPAWVAKIDQRWIRDRNRDAYLTLKITEDTNVFEAAASQFDDDDTGSPDCGLLARDASQTDFDWTMRITPAPDDDYAYDLWCLTKDPFEVESANDDTIIPWPKEFDEGWELFAALRLREAFGPADDVERCDKAFKDWMLNAVQEMNETLTTPAEPIAPDGYGDVSQLPSQSLCQAGYRQDLWPQ